MKKTPFNLRQLIDLLRDEKEIVEISAEVSADQEIAEIHRRVIAADGPALLFRNVTDSEFPLITNLFGTLRRVELGFGHEPKEFIERAAGLVEEGKPPGLGTFWNARDLVWKGLKAGTKTRTEGPVREVQSNSPDLSALPALKVWPEDGGPFITLPHVLTQHPEKGTPNLGIYRMQVYSNTETGMHWQIGKGGGFHYAEAQRMGKPLPVSIILGGPPALILAALAPLPEGVPELLLASLLLDRKLPMIKDPQSGHTIPAEAEFALLGEVSPNETHPEGPFGDHYGYYSNTHDYPVFRCNRVWRRKDAIYPATVVGKPRQEDFYLGDYLQELLSPLIRIVMPSVVDLWSYGETGFHSLAGAIVRERYSREAMMSAFRILGEGQLSLTKFLLLTDTVLDLRDFRKVLEHILARCQWETDLYIFSNLSMDTLDYAGPEVNKGSKGVLMGLGDPVRDLPGAWEKEPPAGTHTPTAFCPGCLVLGGPTYDEDKDFPERLARDESLKGWQLVVVCDRPEQAAASTINFLWTTFTRFEPAADLHPKSSRVHRNHICFEPPVILDARMKPWYPKEVFCDPDVAALVEKRWGEYFPEGGVEMGSSDLAHLTDEAGTS